jgi:hypothetical protein
MKKMRIKLKKELNEDELKYIIHQNLEEKQIIPKLCETTKIFFVDCNKKINVINEQYLNLIQAIK